ncbi:MAG: SDR family oxidoreductase [Halopseudomonas aestusnigri]
MAQLENKTAIITGGTSGIGLATAQLFITEGAQVIITGQDQARLDDAVDQLGNNTQGVKVVAQNPDDAVLLAAVAKEHFGTIDILFANAGVAWSAPLDQIDSSSMLEQFAINFGGPLFAIQNLAPLMKEGSSIVANTSCLNELGMPGMGVYSATKAALRSLVRTLSAELSGQGIRVNSIAPGPIETPIYGKFGMSEEQLGEMAQGIVAQVPAGRFGNANEIASVALFLASDASSYMRGVEIPVDGGWTNL